MPHASYDVLVQRGIANKIYKYSPVLPKSILIFKHITKNNKGSWVPLKPQLKMIDTAFKNKRNKNHVSVFPVWLMRLLLRAAK